jgi:hypothetical protein
LSELLGLELSEGAETGDLEGFPNDYLKEYLSVERVADRIPSFYLV